jgi:hypothetical protein
MIFGHDVQPFSAYTTCMDTYIRILGPKGCGLSHATLGMLCTLCECIAIMCKYTIIRINCICALANEFAREGTCIRACEWALDVSMCVCLYVEWIYAHVWRMGMGLCVSQYVCAHTSARIPNACAHACMKTCAHYLVHTYPACARMCVWIGACVCAWEFIFAYAFTHKQISMRIRVHMHGSESAYAYICRCMHCMSVHACAYVIRTCECIRVWLIIFVCANAAPCVCANTHASCMRVDAYIPICACVCVCVCAYYPLTGYYMLNRNKSTIFKNFIPSHNIRS